MDGKIVNSLGFGGQSQAETYLRWKKVTLGLEILLLIYLFPMRIFLPGIFPFLFGAAEVVIVLILGLGIIGTTAAGEKQYKKILGLLSVECDPYRFKEAMEYLRDRAKSKKEQEACSVDIADALLLEGYGRNAYQVLDGIDFERQPDEKLALYFNVLRRYFCEDCEDGPARRLREQVERCLGEGNLSYAATRQCEYCLAGFDMHFAMQNKDQAAFDQAAERAENLGLTPLQQVALEYSRALMDIAMKRTSRAMGRLDKVIRDGGRLYFVEEAEIWKAALAEGRSLPEKQKDRVDWQDRQMYKPKADVKYFRRNRRFDIGGRTTFAVAIPLLFGIGFLFGYLNGLQFWVGVDLEEAARLPVFYGLMSGLSLAGAVTGIKLLWGLAARRGRPLFAVLCLLGAYYMGMFQILGIIALIPYYIYNLVMLIRARRR